MKRTDYITWDEYFMGVAKLSGMRSKDPSTQVGACIVSQDNKILSMGYNGFPIGCSDDEFPSKKLYMNVTNMRILRQCALPSGCWMRRGWFTVSMNLRAVM